MKKDTFDLPQLKQDVALLTEAAEFFVKMHNPGQDLQKEPYSTLVKAMVNDFIRMEAQGGFKLIKSITMSLEELIKEEALLQEAREIIASLQKQNREKQAEIDRLNNKNFENSIHSEKTKAFYNLLLDEDEAYFDRTGKFESEEYAINYMAAAKHAESWGRKDNYIVSVDLWLKSEDSLPFNRK